MREPVFLFGRNARTFENRRRRNLKRRLNRRWHGRLRRKDEWMERKAHDAWIAECARACMCDIAFCPCASVQAGGFCESNAYDPDDYREDDYED